MVESKNLKLKLGLCGLALTSFLALNSRSVVHADTVSGSNASAITWDSDQDDSQVAHEESQQVQSVQTQGAVQDQKAPATQSVQSSVQNHAETSAVRVSNFDTSVVNRNSAQNARNNVKVATVHDTAQMPVQKQKVAQFNQGSKIYTLNGSNQLSKNNGDGYVITNAGMYNGRAVDIGVTINNVQDNQGTYTTKWSNGDKANVTGKVDNDFNYQNSALVGTTSQQPQVDPNKTRTRMANQSVDFPYKILLYHAGASDWGLTDEFTDDITNSVIFHYENNGNDLEGALRTSVTDDISSHNNYDVSFAGFSGHWDGSDISDDLYTHGSLQDVDVDEDYLNKCLSHVGSSGTITALRFTSNNDDMSHIADGTILIGRGNGKYKMNKQTPVIDYLQLDKVNNGSLNYNYTVGLYDAQTGDLITDLKAEYKGKTGNQATASTNVMNNAIKNKIQQINQGKASVSYTGTSANDDVAFYQETRQVNPQDKNVNRQVQRVIHINFPNGVKPASYDSITDSAGNKLTLDSNNNLTQSMSFTRTGVQNIVSGQVTYGNWQQHGAINAVTLPSIPGYTMVTNN